MDIPYRDNEEALASLLYLMWQDEGKDPDWRFLSEQIRLKWQRVARFTISREVGLVTQMADERNRMRLEKRALDRLQRFKKEEEYERVSSKVKEHLFESGEPERQGATAE